MDSFLSRDNVDMLIEILLDDKPNKTQGDINQIIQEINVFKNTQLNTSTSKLKLIELNQLFLKQMIRANPVPSYQNQTQQQQQQQPLYQQQQQPTKYKVEDLKAERMDFFDQQLAQRRNEFESAITLKKPSVPSFEDPRVIDQPISDMETLMAQTMAQRNLDIPYVSAKPSDWLAPINTSVKTEKQQHEMKLEINEMSEPYDKQSDPPFASIDTQPSSKKISWSDESSNASIPSIFSRLKQSQPTSLESQIETLTQRIAALENKISQISIQ